MAQAAQERVSVHDVAAEAAARLVSVRHWGHSSYINLPMVYPGGGFVTVRIDHAPSGFRVSDNGFAYREIESFGADRSFANTARSVAEAKGILVGKRTVFVEVSPEELDRAIIDVGVASQLIAEKIIERVSELIHAEISEALKERLDEVFTPNHVLHDSKLIGASSSEWEVSAIVKLGSRSAVFQAVSDHAASVYRTSAAFHDIAALHKPPTLVSVVISKPQLGSKLGILSQAGRVIEVGQADTVFKRAAA